MRKIAAGYDSMPWKRWLQLLGVALAAMPHAARSTVLTTPTNIASAALAQQRGHDLCQAILQAYNQRPASETKAFGLPGLDITSTVSRYIEPGISFDQAEQILRAAGLHVSGRPGPEGWNQNRPDRYTVGAYSYEYFNRSLTWRILRPIYRDYSRKLFITLFPERPGDYTKVARVSARVSFDSL